MRARSRSRILCACAVLCASSLYAAQYANAQDLAEAARQEKARKAAKAQKQSYVYTNEDLKHAQILTPEAHASIEARKKNAAPPPVKKVSPADVPSQDTQEAAASESLGEIARRLRQEKAARQAEQAAKLPQPAPFQLDMPHDTTLAHPKPPVRPLVAPALPPSSSSHIVKPPVAAGTLKRDPFSRAVISAAPRSAISAPALNEQRKKSCGTATPGCAAEPSASVSAQARVPVAPTATVFSSVAPSIETLTVIAPTVVTPTFEAPPVAVSPAVVPPATVRAPAISPAAHPSDSVRIQSGDSLWNLSRQYLGKGSRWQEWLTRNPEIGDPRRMKPGTVLIVPTGEPAATLAESSSSLRPDELQPAATISVQPRDSLWRIAATHLGNGANWPCLAHANPNLSNVSLIYPGQTLSLPVSCPEAKPLSTKK